MREPMVFSSYEKMMIFESVRGVVGAKSRQTLPLHKAAIKDDRKRA